MSVLDPNPLQSPDPSPLPMAAPAQAGEGRCDAGKKKRNVSLPVLAPGKAHTVGGRPSRIAKSRVGKWRAAVLIGVHVLIAAHIVLWLIMGMTVSPIEPSEAMYTLEQGLINAGAIFFALALLSTLIFGRYFCGWGCHVVALQDLCSWAMTKLRVKPKPFRSRLLLYVPLILALYMFVWPTFKREVIRPVSGAHWEQVQRYVGETADFPGWSNDLIVRDFWKTFAPWYIAIPFLAICGFGVVYFLGSKGFCTYGCPYGGFFTPIDRLAPGKIRVTDACEGCGHCTAVCTSNVRVHEEVRDYGMVVDPGCMKCLDCVSVCPNDALYFGLGKPGILAWPKDEEARARRSTMKRHYDLTRWQEVVVAMIFALLFYGYRGMFNQVPMLMAVGIAAIGAFLAWKVITLVTEANVRVQSFQLKQKGQVKLAGWVLVLVTLPYLAAGAWGTAVKYHLWRASYAEWDVQVPQQLAYIHGFEAEGRHVEAARRAIRFYTLGGPPKDGGFGWEHHAGTLIRLAYLCTVVGDHAAAEAHLRTALDRGRPRDDLVFGLGQMMAARGATGAEILAMYRETIARYPDLPQVRIRLTMEEFRGGRPEAGLALHEEALKEKRLAWSARTYINAANAAASAGKPERGAELARIALKHLHGATAGIDRSDAAMALARFGQAEEAERVLREHIARRKPTPQTVFALVAVMNTGNRPEAERLAMLRETLGRYPDLHEVRWELAQHELSQRRAGEAAGLYEEALKRPELRRDARVRADAGRVFLAAGRAERAVPVLEEAAALARGSRPETEQILSATAAGLAQAGKLPRAIDILADAAERFPRSAAVRGDQALAQMQAGDLAAALAFAREGVEINPYDAQLAQLLAQVLTAKGEGAEAQRWAARAQRLAATYQRSAGLLPR